MRSTGQLCCRTSFYCNLYDVFLIIDWSRSLVRNIIGLRCFFIILYQECLLPMPFLTVILVLNTWMVWCLSGFSHKVTLDCSAFHALLFWSKLHPTFTMWEIMTSYSTMECLHIGILLHGRLYSIYLFNQFTYINMCSWISIL